MKKIKVAAFLLIMTVGISGAAVAKEVQEKSLRQTFYREQMILFGLYVYGIEQTLAQPVPDIDELHFLANSIEDIAAQIKTTKEDHPYHENMEILRNAVASLKKAKTPDQGRVRGQALINSCANCHRTQLPISGRW